jgi:hypothetical protein
METTQPQNYNSIRHEMQILRRRTITRVKPSGKLYKRKKIINN